MILGQVLNRGGDLVRDRDPLLTRDLGVDVGTSGGGDVTAGALPRPGLEQLGHLAAAEITLDLRTMRTAGVEGAARGKVDQRRRIARDGVETFAAILVQARH